MSYKITDNLIPVGHPNRCGRKLEKTMSLVFHYTANYNKGANALANAKYFARAYKTANGKFTEHTGKPFVYGSAHYIVDDSTIIRAIPENEVAYHVGATKYTAWAVKAFNTKPPNNYTIGIELCVNEGNDWNKTLNSAIELASNIIIRHNITTDMVCRHYDITGKICPAPFVNTAIKEIDPRWIEFKNRLFKRVNEKKGVMTVENKPKRIFKDIDGHYACNSIEYVAKAGLLNGFGDGSYRPDEPLTRGQLAVVLEKLLKKFA